MTRRPVTRLGFALIAATLCSALWFAPRAVADDWPQFRGPTGQGTSTAKGVPVEFGEKKNERWRAELPGRGWSSPVVLAGRIWLTTASDDGRSLRALAVDLESGRLIHNVEVFTPSDPVPINAKNSHASPTAALAPGRVFAHFGAMGTACLDAETAKILWKRDDLKIDHKEGPGSSPVLVDDVLVIHCDGKDEQYVVALDTATGKTRWKTPRSAPFRDNPEFHKAYCTPLLIDVGGRKQLVSPGADQVQGYDPATGKELWRVRYEGFSVVPRPLFSDGLIFVCTGYMKPELWALKPGGAGDVTASHVAWKHTKQIPANPSLIIDGGLLFGVSDLGVLFCLEAATGKPLWQERIGGNHWGSPVSAEGRLYFSSEEGVVSVVRAARTFERLAQNPVGGALFASPALVDRSLVVRTDKALVRFQE